MLDVKIQSTANPAFIDYLCRKSRYGSFILPNFRQKGSGGKIKENRDFRQYYENCAPLIDLVQPYLVKHYVSNHFFYSKYSHALDIYVFEMNKAFRLKVKSCGDFSKWLYPDFPEDFCLFDEQGACILYCQTHEDVCRLFGESEREKKQYCDWGVVYEAYEDFVVDKPCIKTI